ncbi:sensor histidine kinase [Colwellia psychrerythraea]|nr:sensor histidine kinase [Colwellia psychrerythraea]
MKITSKFKVMGLHNKLALLSVLLVMLQTIFLGMFSVSYLEQEFEQQLGEKALSVAQSLAKNPIIVQSLLDKKSQPIQSYVEPIREAIAASFIVVGDDKGIRYSHPNPIKINKAMIGGDSIRALSLGESYVSKAEGSLGVSIRGKTPVLSNDGQIIGLISVGYLEHGMMLSISNYRDTFSWVFGITLVAGCCLVLYIAKRYRDEIFGLEPEEISRVYSERKAVLESILEGVVVIDEQGIISSCNPMAIEILANITEEALIGSAVDELLPDYQYIFASGSSRIWRDIEVDISVGTLILTKTPLMIADKQRGVVVSFRRKDDIVELSEKLSQVKQFSTMLRVQTHEYSNKLNTIGGLIQIGSYDDALDLIMVENTGYQELIAFLMRIVPDPIIAGLILGKYDVAKERKIELIIDNESSLLQVPNKLPRSKLVTILGNILENAFDAASSNKEKPAQVTLSFTDMGEDIIFEIEDSGVGMTDAAIKDIFTFGQTTKRAMGHGIGMFLVKNCLDQVEGTLSITRSKTGGTIMTVYIPK